MAWSGRPRRAPELIAHRRLCRGRLLSMLLRRHPGRLGRTPGSLAARANYTARLAIEALAAREALEARHDEDRQARTAYRACTGHVPGGTSRSSIYVMTQSPDTPKNTEIMRRLNA